MGGTTMLLVARPLVPSEEVRWLVDGQPFVMGWLILSVVWLFCALKQKVLVRTPGIVDWLVALFVILHVISAVVAATEGAPRPNINMLWQWMGFGAAYMILRGTLRSGRQTRALLACMLSLGLFLSGYAVYQYFYFLPQLQQQYREDPAAALLEAGITAAPDAAIRKTFDDRINSTEPFATFALANSFAGYLAPWLVIALAVATESSGKNRRRDQIALCVLALVMLYALYLTGSRSGLLAAAVGCASAIGIALHKRNMLPVKLLIGSAVALLIMVSAVAIWSEQVVANAVKSLQYRIEYWQSTLQLIADYPWLGVGPGSFKDYYPAYKLPVASEEISDPHNVLLEVWSTAGTPAAVALIVLLGCFCWKQLISASTEIVLGEEPMKGEVKPVLLGAGAGFVFAGFVRLIAGFSASPVEIIVGIGVIAVVVWLLTPWILNGVIPRGVALLGVLVLLINLLAAGGINYPAVAGTLWLLLAVGMNALQPHPSSPVGPKWAAIALGVAAIAAGAFYWTGYGPVLGSESALAQAGDPANDSKQREMWLHRAIAADPLAPQPPGELAQLYLQQWLITGDGDLLGQFESYAQLALRLQPRSYPRWQQLGENYLLVYGKSKLPEHAAAADAAFERAVELYPTSAAAWGKWALALQQIGEDSRAIKTAAQALTLSEQTPHLDKKLDSSVHSQLTELLNAVE